MKPSRLFADAVDEGLSVLGQSPKDTIYGFLQQDYGMKKDDIPQRFQEFSSILMENVGPSGGHVLEFIIERFYSKLDRQAPKSPSLGEAITNVQKILKKEQNLSHIEDFVNLPP